MIRGRWRSPNLGRSMAWANRFARLLTVGGGKGTSSTPARHHLPFESRSPPSVLGVWSSISVEKEIRLKFGLGLGQGSNVPLNEGTRRLCRASVCRTNPTWSVISVCDVGRKGLCRSPAHSVGLTQTHCPSQPYGQTLVDKAGPVQTVTMSGFGQPRLRCDPIVNRLATESHASSDSHILGESIGPLTCQCTRQSGHCRIAK